MKHYTFKAFLLFATILLTTMTTKTSEAELLKAHLHKKTLDNGLTLLVKEVPGSKAATVQLWVKAGSIYEKADEGGITHLIEHMIFKGTETRGAGEIAGAIEEKGGQINAYTSFEYTVYHATLSARYWQTAMEVLTDAVLNSVFDPKELEREKKVVLEEIKMRNDRPSVKLFQYLMSTGYEKHPYKLPIIGTVESVSSFSTADIKAYMARHYFPQNFTVVIVGDVKFESVERKVEKLFRDIPAKNAPGNNIPKEPEQKSPRVFAVEDEINQSQMALAFPIPAFDSEDTPTIDIIASLLGQGETSRLYNELRNKKGLVYKINASAFTPKYPGLLEVTAILNNDNIIATAEAALKEIFKLKYIPVDEEELTRVKTNLESDFIFNLERVEGQARVIGSFDALTGDPREDEYLTRVKAVTSEDVIRVARKYFSDKKLTAGIIAPKGTDLTFDHSTVTKIIKKAERAAKAEIPTSLLADTFLPNTHRFTLKNGITLLVRENQQIPTVAIRAVFPGGLTAETTANNGAFAFISDILSKGTEKMSYRELALQLSSMAGEVTGFNGRNTFGLKASFLPRYYKKGLEIIRDVITIPAFDPEEVEKIRPERISQLKLQEDSLPSLAFREFNKILFKGHPYALNTAGNEETLQSLQAEALKQIYTESARPESLVLAVAGKVKAEEVKETISELFESWQNTSPSATNEESLPPLPPASPKIFQLNKEKEQTHIIIGFTGTTLSSSDRYALEILDTVLSGQSGRLFRQLRDKQSLAYSLSSFNIPGIDTGSFGIYIGTSPSKKEEAIQAAWQELYNVRNNPIEKEELEKAKNIVIGHYELGLQTHGAQAMEMALNETYNLGQDYGNRFIHEISKVTAEDVLAIAKKYIQSDHYVLVTVGAE